MPDRFQEFPYLSYPSPPGSAESPCTSNDGNTVDPVIGFSGWTQDHGLDALYTQNMDLGIDAMPELTDEDLQFLASVPPENFVFPRTHDARQTFLLSGFPYNQNGPADVQNTIPTPPAQPNTPLRPTNGQLLPLSQQPKLPAVALPPTPPQLQSSRPLPQHSDPSSVGSVNRHVQQHWPPVPPSAERQRIALPAPGDIQYSACEVIM